MPVVLQTCQGEKTKVPIIRKTDSDTYLSIWFLLGSNLNHIEYIGHNRGHIGFWDRSELHLCGCLVKDAGSGPA